MRFALALATMLTALYARAESAKIKFDYQSADIVQVLNDYAKASHTKFIVDPSVHGKITILNPEPIALDEAFNQLSSALALNSLAISTQGDMMVVNSARNIQRDLIDVGTELPPLRPQKMFTYIIRLKNSSADEVNKQLRILTSKDGEEVPYREANEIVVTDWVSNLYRIQKILAQLDQDATKKHRK